MELHYLFMNDFFFHLGAIKKKYTPKPRNQNVSDNLDDDNEYDLQVDLKLWSSRD